MSAVQFPDAPPTAEQTFVAVALLILAALFLFALLARHRRDGGE